MSFVIFVLLATIIYMIYVRYYPIKGIPCMDMNQLSKVTKKVKLDIRDYNTSAKNTVTDSVLLPIAYLRRHHNEIPSKQIYLIASDKIERNLAARMLKQKGFQIMGYTITSCDCEKRSKRVA
ncbi:hypothetical protein BN1058_01371 [Paraliobacillus sp. PM-2]|uniref:hypothetical protein n=1 Tax=Paraliobacillus sp. PM-2 TaxID=1462524 RepID=UPI00061B96D5|nr:hypothetical protein [Paraliobacillus sp. PM-2]CQR47082.1 hypothetical protein BN1058_01371 [Paraliobacillus sp. PM-2]